MPPHFGSRKAEEESKSRAVDRFVSYSTDSLIPRRRWMIRMHASDGRPAGKSIPDPTHFSAGNSGETGSSSSLALLNLYLPNLVREKKVLLRG